MKDIVRCWKCGAPETADEDYTSFQWHDGRIGAACDKHDIPNNAHEV